MRVAVICEPLRKPVGRYGGVVRDVSAADLAAAVILEMVGRTGVAPEHIDDVLTDRFGILRLRWERSRVTVDVKVNYTFECGQRWGSSKNALGEHFFCRGLVRTALLGIGVEHETMAGLRYRPLHPTSVSNYSTLTSLARCQSRLKRICGSFGNCTALCLFVIKT
jgi:hypothetical protein